MSDNKSKTKNIQNINNISGEPAAQKRLVLINDFTGFGRCALTVSLPIVSAFGIQGVPVPTAVLSNHLGFKSYFYEDFSDRLHTYLDSLNALSFSFDGIYTGYLGNHKNAETVIKFINNTKHTENTIESVNKITYAGNTIDSVNKITHAGNTIDFANKITHAANKIKSETNRGHAEPQVAVPNLNPPLIITDPVMGDNGRPYSTHTDELLDGITRLVRISDIIIPNLTEACMLTGTEYSEDLGDDALYKIADKLMSLMIKNSGTKDPRACLTYSKSDSKHLVYGNHVNTASTRSRPKRLVITGMPYKDSIGNLVYEENNIPQIFKSKITGSPRPGTGDIFASVLSSCLLMERDFAASVCDAADFVAECIGESERLNIPPLYGVCFERILSKLF